MKKIYEWPIVNDYYYAYQFNGKNLKKFCRKFQERFYDLNPHIFKNDFEQVSKKPECRQFKINDWKLKHIKSGIVSIANEELFKEFKEVKLDIKRSEERQE